MSNLSSLSSSSLSRLRSSSFSRLRSYNQQPTTQATTPSSPPGHLISPTQSEPQILSMSNLSSLSSSSLSRLRSYKQPPTTQAHSISTNPSSTTTATTPSSPPAIPSNHPILPFDLELANHSDIGMPAEWIQIGKVAQPVGLGGFGASITLFVTAPVSAAIHPALYTAYLTVVFLGIFSAIGLSIFSALMKEGPTVGWVQKKLIYFTFSFVSLACILRLQLALSLVNIGFVAAVIVLTGMVLMVLLYLLLVIMCQRHTNEPGRES